MLFLNSEFVNKMWLIITFATAGLLLKNELPRVIVFLRLTRFKLITPVGRDRVGIFNTLIVGSIGGSPRRDLGKMYSN
jgi:hypothetical protein